VLARGHFQLIAVDVFLAIFMILGYNWARWVMLAYCGFGFIGGVSSAFGLTRYSELGGVLFLFLVVVVLVQIAFSLFLGTCLLFSKRVNEHFNT
jgi:hypothetical protein